MEKLAEDIWKALLFSLIFLASIVGILRYVESEDWWRVGKIAKESERGSPLVYYSVKGVGNDLVPTVDLYIKNTIQDEQIGRYGTFENLLPGQSASVKITIGNQSIRSPSFILGDREIKSLVFNASEKELVYVGCFSRIREVIFPKFVHFEEAPDIFGQLGAVFLDKYKLTKEAKAEEERGEVSNLPNDSRVHLIK